MKKFARIILCFCMAAMLVCVAACGTDKPTPTPPPDPNPPVPTEKVLTDIEITKNPDKMNYAVGEVFDPSGMVVSAKYDNGETEKLDSGDYKVASLGALDEENKFVEVTYKDKTTFVTGVTVGGAITESKTYRYESEEGRIISEGTAVYDCSFISPSSEASGGYLLNVRKTGVGGATVDGGAGKYGVGWTVNSDRQTVAQLKIRVSNRTAYESKNKRWRADVKRFTAMYDMFVNDVQRYFTSNMYQYGADMINGDEYRDANAKVITYSEFQWKDITMNVKLEKGDNKIEFLIKGTTNAGPIDYIELVTDANLTDKTEKLAHTVAADAGEYEVVLTPTVDEAGYIGKKCSVCNAVAPMHKLPKLAPDAYASCAPDKAATETENGVGTYTYEYEGQTFTFENAAIPALGEMNTYRFESENGKVTLSGHTDLDCKSDLAYIGAYVARASGAAYLNPGDAEKNPAHQTGSATPYAYKAGDKIEFKLNADKAASATLTLRIAKPVMTAASIELNKLWKITVGGETVFADEVSVNKDAGKTTASVLKGHDWVTFTTSVPLKAGDNDVVLEMQHDETNEDASVGFASSIDYIEVSTAANINNKTVGNVHDMMWFVTKAPTATKEGEAVLLCKHCDYMMKASPANTLVLPVLNSENYALGENIATYTAHNGLAVKVSTAEREQKGLIDNAWKKDGVLKILSIGNSYSEDLMEYVYEIASGMGIDVVIGNIKLSACSIDMHAENAKNDAAVYKYFTYANGSKVENLVDGQKDNYKMSDAIAAEDWDFVLFQQQSDATGRADTYGRLDELIAYVRGKLPKGCNAKFGFHLTWAYQKDVSNKDRLEAFTKYYDADQNKMYQANSDTVKQVVESRDTLEFVVPSGTAVQNARSSFIGDTITRDGYHMSYSFGRYLIGLTLVGTLTGKSIDSCTFAPPVVNEAYRAVAIEAVNNAIASPYKPTASVAA